MRKRKLWQSEGQAISREKCLQLQKSICASNEVRAPPTDYRWLRKIQYKSAQKLKLLATFSTK